MAVVILSHPVSDFKSWKAGYDADTERRTAAGLKEIVVGQDAEDPSMAYMVYETDNPGKLQEMLSDPNLADKMKESGVTGPPNLTIIQ